MSLHSFHTAIGCTLAISCLRALMVGFHEVWRYVKILIAPLHSLKVAGCILIGIQGPSNRVPDQAYTVADRC